MKKVLLYLSMKPYEGGKYQYSINILDGLVALSAQHRLSLTVVCTDPHWKKLTSADCIIHNDAPRYFEKKIKRLMLVKLRWIAIWRFLGKYIDPLQRLFYTIDPDVIFYPGNDSYAYECSIPSIIPIFDLMHRYEPRFAEVGEQTIVREREERYRNICRYARTITVDSACGKQHVIESYGCSPEKIVVLPYTPSRYVYEPFEPNSLEKYHLPEHFIFYPAQFWSHKNHRIIIQALCILRDRNRIKIHAVFVGSPKNAYDDVQKMIHETQLDDQIHILGYVENIELVALYHKADALVFPSYFGPTNIPPLEAAAIGCPVVLSDVYAHREQMGDSAIYFNPDNRDGLAGILAKYSDGMRTNIDRTPTLNRWNQDVQQASMLKILELIIDTNR